MINNFTKLNEKVNFIIFYKQNNDNYFHSLGQRLDDMQGWVNTSPH